MAKNQKPSKKSKPKKQPATTVTSAATSSPPAGYTPAVIDPTIINIPATMTEPRARAARQKGQMNFGLEMGQMLYAFGDVEDPLPETVRILDEITTDFIIDSCHQAAKVAHHAGRTKVKAEDFKFVMRNNELMQGRVKELFAKEKEFKEARKQFNDDEGRVGLERGGRKKKDQKGDGIEMELDLGKDDEKGDEDMD